LPWSGLDRLNGFRDRTARSAQIPANNLLKLQW